MVSGTSKGAEGIRRFDGRSISVDYAQMFVLARSGTASSLAAGKSRIGAIRIRFKGFGEVVYKESAYGEGNDEDQQSQTKQGDVLEEVAERRNN